ncbi:MAG: hypothetical protein K9J25_05300 [Bacteroidales bacterium]|nr:hypothetical protein [Bacteroidales bacterium]
MKRKAKTLLSGISIMVIISLSSFSLTAQEDKIDAILDSMFFSTDEEILLMLAEMNRNHNFIYSRVGYDNKTTYAGREIGSDQYNLSGQLFYLNSTGLYLGLSGAWYSQLDPSYRSTVVTGGYSNSLKKASWLRYRISYNRYFYNTDASSYDPDYTGSLSAGITLKNDNFGIRTDYSFLMGNEYASQASFDLFGDFLLFKPGKRSKIEFTPELSFYFGSEAVEYERISYLSGNSSTSDMSEFIYMDKFGLMNTSINIPLEISLGDFSLELSYKYNFPRSLDPNYMYDNNSLFSISLSYFFMIN